MAPCAILHTPNRNTRRKLHDFSSAERARDVRYDSTRRHPLHLFEVTRPTMATATHRYTTQLVWTGNRGDGTSGYHAYDRAHEITVAGKPVIPGSSDPHFRGDAARYNPEELLVASLSACHMLWFLHLCADAGIRVVAYTDSALGTMQETADGGGRFTEVVLQPAVRVAGAVDRARIAALHERAHARCFIASSVNFPVRCEATLETERDAASS